MNEIDREKYYSDRFVLKKISFYCRWKEVCILKHLPEKEIMIRPIKIFKESHVRWWIDRLHLKEIPFDIYHSNASIVMPKLPTDIKKLKETRTYLNKQWKLFMQGKNTDFVRSFDFFADIDVNDIKQRDDAIEYAKTVYNELKKRDIGIPEIWDTGRGYHVLIRGRFTPKFCKNLLIEICNTQELPYASNGDLKPNVDDKVTGDIRRIRRCEYGLHSKTNKPMTKIR